MTGYIYKRNERQFMERIKGQSAWCYDVVLTGGKVTHLRFELADGGKFKLSVQFLDTWLDDEMPIFLGGRP